MQWKVNNNTGGTILQLKAKGKSTLSHICLRFQNVVNNDLGPWLARGIAAFITPFIDYKPTVTSPPFRFILSFNLCKLLLFVIPAAIFAHVLVLLGASPTCLCLLWTNLNSLSSPPQSPGPLHPGRRQSMQPPLFKLGSVRFDAIDKDNGKFISLIEFLRRKFYVYVMISPLTPHPSSCRDTGSLLVTSFTGAAVCLHCTPSPHTSAAPLMVVCTLSSV